MASSTRPITRPRPRNLFASVQQVLLHPVAFFKGLSALAETRTWLWAGLLILSLVGYSTIQQNSTPDADTQSNLVIGLTASGGLALAWLAQVILLAPISMFRGFAPKWDINLQIAIWASIPFGVMAIIQIAYLSAGGVIASAGLAGVIPVVPWFNEWDDNLLILIDHSLRHITFFGIWALLLFTIGAKQALQGQIWTIAVCVVFLIGTIIFIPALFDILMQPV